MDETCQKLVELFYKHKPEDTPLLLCMLELDRKTQLVAVESAFTGDYRDGVVFLSAIVSNLALTTGRSPKTVILDLVRDLEEDAKNNPIVERGDIIIDDGKVVHEAKPEKKKLEIISDEPDTDE